MGQENSNAKLSQNFIVFGVNLLLDEKLMGSEWQKDQINSCQDFTLYKNISEKPNQLLWCPKYCEILQNTVESIILNIEFEGVLYVFEHTQDQKVLNDHRKLLKWLMSEDSMRQCSLILLCVSKSNDLAINIKSQMEIELDLESMDSKQARNLIIKQKDKESHLKFQKIIQQLIKMKIDS
ncbi:unnamed protein product [Paramecium pentaurelia]|uniref:Uncharacterized protein n=1 Tax=Paramecium pentaurelia TaxID=43138 RepID=A0A8S1UV79_9CILI|nr:unnamed protein product [Paramecium pentaurelia]